MNALMQAVQAALEQSGLWREGAKLLCALSGGCDSVALIHALSRLKNSKNMVVKAVHVQHGLRGEDSAEDERFVRLLCQELQIPLIVEKAKLTGDMHTPGMETMARDCRRQIFARQMKAMSADALLTAHHQNDQAETVLMHLLRGSGMQGLCGMQTAAPFGDALVIRPFLTLPKQQLRDALASENLPFREDGSNQEAVTPRNAIRLMLMPQLETLFPGSAGHMARLAETLAQDEACLSALADNVWQQAVYTRAPLFMLSLQALEKSPEAIRRRVLRRWFTEGLLAAGLQPEERALSHADTLALSALIHQPAGSCVNLPCGLMAARETDWLHLAYQSGQPLCAAESYAETVKPGTAQYVLPHMTLYAAPAEHLPRDAFSILLTRGQLNRLPVLRLPQPGDVIRPFGAPGHKQLRRYLTDRKIDPFLRAAWSVLCVENEVLWIPGLCASEALRLDTVPSDGIQLTLSGNTPFPLKTPKE